MSNKKGFTLLELLIAIFILSVGILGAYVTIQKSVTLASYSHNRLTAAYLAQEGIEIMRNIKDTNLLEGLAGENEWTEDLGLLGSGLNNYEVHYLDVSDQHPIITPCLTPCDFNSLSPLRRDDSFYTYSATEDTKFKRKVSINLDPIDPDTIKISSTVYWQDGKVVREFTVWDIFYNWL